MKKVLFVIPSLGGGGAEKVLINLVNSLDESKYNITVYSIENNGINKKYLNDNINYKYSFNKTIKGFRHLLKLFTPKYLFKKLIGNEKYDVIISFLEGPTTRIVSGCDSNCKLISWIHTENKKAFSIAFRSYNEMIKAYSKYNKIICVSNDVLFSFNQYTNNIFSDKTSFIRNINNPNTIISLAGKKNRNVNEDIFRMIVVGRLDKNKDYARLLPIVYRLTNKGLKIELLILGEGSEEKNISNLINKYNLNNVKMLGYQENPYTYMINSDLFICCSHYEGFSTTTIEALILNTPVLTTNCSGMEQILGKNECGIIVDDSDIELEKEIELLIDNTELINKIKHNQRIKIKELKRDYHVDLKKIEHLL